jgi:ankyrin repeat protein
VKLLLEKGAKLETKDSSYGRTPLLYAAEKGHEGGGEAAARERR